MPSVLFYVQHLLGIGHLMRARCVAEALAGDGFNVHLVCGGRPILGRPPSGVRTVQLPPIYADDPGMKVLRGVDGGPIDEAYRHRRRDLLIAEFESVAPEVVVFETFPFGRRAMHFELLPLLDRIDAARPRPIVVSSVRDILQRRQKAKREEEMLALAQRGFDAILVHGDARFAKFDETFPQAASLGLPWHHTGFVVAADAPPSPFSGVRREIVVSAGGGAVGMRLLAAALAARRQSAYRDNPWRLLVGANVSDHEMQGLVQNGGGDVIVERARADFSALLSAAFISVSQAGYNTVLDVVRSGAHPVLVPYAEHGETEQVARAGRLRELNLAVVVDEDDLSAAALARAIDAAGSRESWGRWDFDCGGAARSAMLIRGMSASASSRDKGATS
ncbi:MAG: glycosyltransferase [Betaproteobacteria bacterium]